MVCASPHYVPCMRSGFATSCESLLLSCVLNRNKSQLNTQRYRSGHNGADSKSVWEQSHEGSNPSLCANGNLNRTPMFEFRFFCFLLGFIVLRIRVFEQGFCPVFSIVNHLWRVLVLARRSRATCIYKHTPQCHFKNYSFFISILY